MRTFRLKNILIAFLCLYTGATALGQDNPYKIDNECYELYLKSISYRGQDSCLVCAHDMRELAIQKGDSKAETISYVVALQHAFKSKDIETINASAEEVMGVAKRTGYMQYYFYAYSSRITYFLNNNSRVSALRLAEEMNSRAVEYDNDFGRWSSSRCLGNIYFAAGNAEKSRDYRKIALKYSVNVPDQPVARLYMDIADTFSDKDSIAFYLEKMGENLRIDSDSTAYFASMAKFSGTYDNFKNFNKWYRAYHSAADKNNHAHISNNQATEIEIFNLIRKNNLEEAESMIQGMASEYMKCFFMERISLCRGDAKTAYDYALRRMDIQTATNSKKHYADIVEMEQNMRNERMEAEANHNSFRLAQMEARAKHNNYVIFMMGTLLVLALLIIISLTLFYYQKKLVQEQKEKEAAQKILEQEKEKAEHASAMKSMYLQNMSHEIRTPLNAIIGFSQLLAMPDDFVTAEEKEKYLEYISNSANILNMHVDDILNISDIESGNYNVKDENCDINEICRFSMKSVEYRVKPGVKLYFTTDMDEGTTCITDGRRIQQVIINFLSNACKHTEKGEIKVHCSLTDDRKYVSISVTDTGEGIQGENRTDIFNRFVKLDNMKEGTGIGLNICKGIAKRLSGKVYLDPDYTTGCKFVFLFPFRQ